MCSVDSRRNRNREVLPWSWPPGSLQREGGREVDFWRKGNRGKALWFLFPRSLQGKEGSKARGKP